MKTLHENAYELLSIRPPFTEDQLKTAFREAVKKHHPDVGGNAKMFIAVKDAYKLLEPDAGKDKVVDVIRRTVDGVLLESLGKGVPGGKICLSCNGAGYYTLKHIDGDSFMTMMEMMMDYYIRGGPAPNPRQVKEVTQHFLCNNCGGKGQTPSFNPLFVANSIPPTMTQKERKRMEQEKK